MCQNSRCREILNAIRQELLNIHGKLVFDGSIENLDCIIQHEEYKAIMNRAMLENVATLLRCKNGRSYRRRSGVTHDE